MLPNPDVLHKSISLIVQAFSDVVAMEALRVRWEEIKKLQKLNSSKTYEFRVYFKYEAS
jgi:hypothetical protein